MPLTQQQLDFYLQEGYLIVPDLFTPKRYEPIIEWINSMVADLADHLHERGLIQNKHENEGFYTRLTALEREYPGAALLIHIGGILGQPLADLWADPKLLDIVEQMIGPEIAGHAVWNLRSKTPLNPLATVPWHQDTAYLKPGAESTFQPTAWIPLIDADATNGTLQVLRRGHTTQVRGQLLRQHQLEASKGNKASWYLYIDEQDLGEGEVVTCNMPLGSVLFINQLIPHRSTENRSNRIRWSVDLRWQRPGEPHGFEGIKDPILMRTASDPDYQINWSQWSMQSRTARAIARHRDSSLDTTVMGPWLTRWAKSQEEASNAGIGVNHK